MAVDIRNTSRLSYSDLLSIDSIEFWDIMELPVYRARPGDTIHTVLDGDRIDLLAYEYYQDPSLGWIILWANNIEIAPLELETGMQLVIPDPNYIAGRLSAGTIA